MKKSGEYYQQGQSVTHQTNADTVTTNIINQDTPQGCLARLINSAAVITGGPASFVLSLYVIRWLFTQFDESHDIDAPNPFVDITTQIIDFITELLAGLGFTADLLTLVIILAITSFCLRLLNYIVFNVKLAEQK